MKHHKGTSRGNQEAVRFPEKSYKFKSQREWKEIYVILDTPTVLARFEINLKYCLATSRAKRVSE